MEQHPIPQNVSSYQFKLVGDMTLKQFFQLAGGIVGGIIFYSTPLLPIIRYPLALLSVLLGIGLAFLPFEERPLERWIFAFFRAIYSPTQFNWKKTVTAPKFYQDEAVVAPTTQQDTNQAYLSTTPQTSAPGNLDKAEKGFLSRLSILFGQSPKISLPPTEPVKESEPVPSTNPVPPTPVVAKPLQIPQTPAIKIPVASRPIVVQEQTNTPVQNTTTNTVAPIIAGNEMISTKQALFSIDAAPPSPPTYPNVVVGQVVDQDRKIIEGAIMEIRDSAGRPIRALRSNKVGHFITVTQLDNERYEILTEKDGYEFTPVNFEATGTIIPPILVQGKRLGPPVESPSVIVKPLYSIN
jgi:hypothetical protein